MGNFRGIVLYNIELDGNLNGVYTNNHRDLSGRILTETLRPIGDPIIEEGNEVYNYNSLYFDALEDWVDCTLKLTISNRIYTAEWSRENVVIFQGEGFRMNERQIAITYWNIIS